MRIPQTVLAALALVAAHVPAKTDLIPMPGSGRIDAKLFAGADLVCAARIDSQRDDSKEPERSSPGKLTVFLVRRSASVTLSRCYKGSASKAVVTYETHEPSNGDRVRNLAVGTQHLLFLTLVGPQTYALSYDFIADWSISLSRLTEWRDGGPGQLQEDVVANLELSPAPAVIDNLRILGALERLTTDSLTAVRRLYLNPNPLVDVEALIAAIPSGKPEDLAAFADFMSRVDPSPVASSMQVRSLSVLEGLSDPEALNSLQQLCASSFPSVRLAAIRSIRKLHAPRSVPFLIGFLDNADPVMRYDALITLAEITDRYGENAPSMALFDRAPGMYVELWKGWWKREGKAKYDLAKIPPPLP